MQQSLRGWGEEEEEEEGGTGSFYGADRSPPTTGANGTTDRNPKGQTATLRNSLS